ncbi:MAG: ClpXP protease specificity-enhancing factor SspB [Pseudomonadota bacterium]
MTDEHLDYERMVDDALRSVMVRSLHYVAAHGLSGDHHFYVTFRTDHPQAVVGDELKSKYPEEITIVLQHQFWDLDIGEEGFSVTLSFNQSPQTLTVPFGAVTAFVDPSVKFGLQFKPSMDGADHPAAMPVAVAKDEPIESNAPEQDDESGKVVALDEFRKK